MNWENSKACTPLKRDILKSWFSHEERYFLTGGSALAIFYLDHRYPYDLYFLEQAGHDILASIPDAKIKDGGWDSAMASMLLESISIEKPPPLLIKDIDIKDLLAFKERLRLSFANDALSHS